jgi:hypothetical protein
VEQVPPLHGRCFFATVSYPLHRNRGGRHAVRARTGGAIGARADEVSLHRSLRTGFEFRALDRVVELAAHLTDAEQELTRRSRIRETQAPWGRQLADRLRVLANLETSRQPGWPA